MPLSKRMPALDVAHKSADAYSADIWGPVMWVQAAQMLLEMDFNEQEVEDILRSKLTRWARDAWGDPATWIGQLCVLATTDKAAIKSGSLHC